MRKMFSRGVLLFAVCIGMCTGSSKATLEQDLLKVCKRYDVDPESADMSRLLRDLNQLYVKFCKDVAKEENKLRANRREDAVAFEDIGETLRLPTGEEVEVLKFCKCLWELILKYEHNSEMLFLSKSGVFKYGCRFVFMRRMFEVVLICVRNFAEKFLSEESLFDKNVFKFDEKVAESAMSEIWKHLSANDDDYKKLKEICFGSLVQFGESMHEHDKPRRCQFKGSDNFLLRANKALDEVRLKEMIQVCHVAASTGSSTCENMITVLFEARSHWQKPLMSSEKEAWKEWMGKVWDCSESFLTMRNEAERKKKIQENLADIVKEKNSACNHFNEISEELEAFEKERGLLCTEVSELRKKLVEIRKDVKGGEKNDKKKESDELRKAFELKEEKLSSLCVKIEALKVKASKSYRNMINVTKIVEEVYEEFSLEFPESQEVNFASRTLCLKDYVACLRSFSYCHTHICNSVHQFVTQRMSLAGNIFKHNKPLGEIKCLKKLQLTDDFEEEYFRLVYGRYRSSSLDKRRSKIRTEREESVLINEESLNTGFVREDKERERGKSAGLKRTRKFDF